MLGAFAKATQSGGRKLAAGWIRETRSAMQWLAGLASAIFHMHLPLANLH
jgi:hypothetical protein